MKKQWCYSTMVAFVLTMYVGERGLCAQPIDPANVPAAQRLYDEAATLMEAQRYVEACLKLERVTKLVPSGLGGHEMLAECYAQIGRLGSAWEQYTMARALAYAAAKADRAVQNEEKAKALEPRVAKITITVPKELHAIEGLTILRDGQPQERALWNTPLPVDSGDHVIEVKATERKPWTKKLMILANGASVTVTVAIGGVQPLATRKPEPVRPWQKPLGWTTASIGAASLITSGILSGLAVGKKNASNADGHCGANNVCDEVGKPLREQAMSLANGATATIVIGGVLAAGGLVLALTAPKPNKEQDASGQTGGLSLSTTISPMGIGLRGTW